MLGHGHDLGRPDSLKGLRPQTQTRKCRWRWPANRGRASSTNVAPECASPADASPYRVRRSCTATLFLAAVIWNASDLFPRHHSTFALCPPHLTISSAVNLPETRSQWLRLAISLILHTEPHQHKDPGVDK